MSSQESVGIMKIVIIGESGVGKTCLLERYVENNFNELDHTPTIGVEFKMKNVEIESENNDIKKFKVQLWDTAGQEKFRSIAETYYRGANGAAIVFDITSYESFESIQSWIDDFTRLTDDNHNIIIIGNKADLESKREIESSKATEFALSKKLEYIETSAKTGEKVTDAFEKLEKLISHSLDNRITPEKITLNDSNKGGCC